MKANSTAQKILDFTLTKIVIGAVVIIGLIQISQRGMDKLLSYTSLDKELIKVIVAIVVMTLTVVGYSVLFRYYEKRKISELSSKGIFSNLLAGILLGAVLQSLTILVIYLNGGFRVMSINPFVSVIPGLIAAFTAAIIEEILIRGILFRIMEEKLGSLLALGISAFIFGMLHLANPNSSFISAMGVAIEAGLLLGAAYIYTRNLWFPIAIHFAWNFTQSGIFGASTSGRAISHSLLTTQIQGATWFSGGTFGPEGSLQAVLFCLVATTVLMILNYRQDNMIAPYWKKKAAPVT